MPIRKIGKEETRRPIGYSVEERPLSGTRNVPNAVRKNRERRDSSKDRLLSRRTAAFRNAECAAARPENREIRDSLRDRLLSRRTAAFRNAGGAAVRPGNRERRDSPKDRLLSRRTPSLRARNAPTPVRKSGNRRLSGRSASQSGIGIAQERRARRRPSEKSAKPQCARPEISGGIVRGVGR